MDVYILTLHTIKYNHLKLK